MKKVSISSSGPPPGKRGSQPKLKMYRFPQNRALAVALFFDTLWETAGDGVVHVSIASSGPAPDRTGRQPELKMLSFPLNPN